MFLIFRFLIFKRVFRKMVHINEMYNNKYRLKGSHYDRKNQSKKLCPKNPTSKAPPTGTSPKWHIPQLANRMVHRILYVEVRFLLRIFKPSPGTSQPMIKNLRIGRSGDTAWSSRCRLKIRKTNVSSRLKPKYADLTGSSFNF